jgi:hypothetical protein
VSASYGVFASELVFGDVGASIERRAFAAALEYRLTPDVTLQAGAGLGHGGRLVLDGGGAGAYHELLPGWLAMAAASWRVVSGAGARPFVLLSATLGASGASTRALRADETVAYTAVDLRLGAVVGKTFFEVLSPYAAARVFGGPILWRFRGEDRMGTDRYHVQVGAGLAVSLPRRFDVFVEIAPLGERSATVGVGRAF